MSGKDSQLADAQESLAEETRQKLTIQAKLRQEEERANQMQEALEEEEEAKKALENKITELNRHVCPLDFQRSFRNIELHKLAVIGASNSLQPSKMFVFL